jgi:hypothetical protein
MSDQSRCSFCRASPRDRVFSPVPVRPRADRGLPGLVRRQGPHAARGGVPGRRPGRIRARRAAVGRPALRPGPGVARLLAQPGRFRRGASHRLDTAGWLAGRRHPLAGAKTHPGRPAGQLRLRGPGHAAGADHAGCRGLSRPGRAAGSRDLAGVQDRVHPRAGDAVARVAAGGGRRQRRRGTGPGCHGATGQSRVR